VLSWDDILLTDFSRPILWRLFHYVIAFFDFILTGTVFRYFRAGYRYALFFFVPFFQLVLFVCLGVLGAQWAARWLGFGSPLVAPAIAIVVFFGLLLVWPGRWWRVSQALDDWIFAREFLRGQRPDLDARIDSFADVIAARARDTSIDEVVVLGHSLGASLVLDSVARALARDPELGKHGPAFSILTVGSTIPKFSLHPRGGDLRAKMARVAAEPSILWGEYQARDDFISFYKFDPVSQSRVDTGKERADLKPIIKVVAIPNMIEKRTMLRFRLRFLRLHYQFVMANERRSHYDYFMLICGPFQTARVLAARHGFLDLIAADGMPIEPAGAAAQSRPRGACASDQAR
jgi:hypothetical protein